MAIESDEPDGAAGGCAKGSLEVRRKLKAMVDGYGLRVQELKAESVISNPMEPERGRIRIEHSDGFVSLEKTFCEFLGNLEGYGDEEDATESGVGADEILSALGKQARPIVMRSNLLPIEQEAKVLDIDPQAVTALILRAGGYTFGGPKLMRRYVYDIVPGDMSKWIRLRDTGRETTLCVNEIRSDAIDGTHEVETSVGDFAATNELLTLMGFTPKSYQENRRTSFTLEGVRLEIDEWPLIPPYLEIEADTRHDVVRVAGLLGYQEHQLTGENTLKVYARYGMELGDIRELRF